MALIKCSECGKDISDSSDICIHCGYVLRKQLKCYQKKPFIIGTIVVVSILLIVFIVRKNGDAKIDNNEVPSYIYDYILSKSTDDSYNDFSTLDDFTFANWSISNGTINDTVYVEVTNNTNGKFRGSATAYIYKDNVVVSSATILFPNEGIPPNDTVTVHGIFNTVNGNYDNVTFEINYTYNVQ